MFINEVYEVGSQILTGNIEVHILEGFLCAFASTINNVLQYRCSATLCNAWFTMKFMAIHWLQLILSLMSPVQEIMHLWMSSAA